MGGLTLWSFLMASAHGAGLMVLPVFLSMNVVAVVRPATRGVVNSGICWRHGNACTWIGLSAVTHWRRGLWSIALGWAPAEGLDQSRCDLGGGVDSHRGPDFACLIRA